MRIKHVSIAVAILIATSNFAGAPYAANAAANGPVPCSGGGTFTIDTDVVVSSSNCVGVANIPSGVSVNGVAFAASPGLTEINFAEIVLGSPWAASASVQVSGKVECSVSGWFKIALNEVVGRFNCRGSVDIPAGVTAVKDQAFDADPSYGGLGDPGHPSNMSNTIPTNITSLSIPNTVTSIEQFAFRGTNSPSIVIPNSVTTLGDYAFTGSTMESLTIGNGLSSIPTTAFQYIGTLESLTLGTGLREIGQDAFAGSALQALTIPNEVISIGDNAFTNSGTLTSLTLGTGLRNIGQSAFAGSDLQALTIPAGVESIGSGAFDPWQSTTTPVYCGNADLTSTGLLSPDPSNCAPAPPLNLVASQAGGGVTTIGFARGAAGGSPIERHEYSFNGGSYSSGDSPSPISLTGLIAGNSYTISIRAVSQLGSGTPNHFSFVAGFSAYTVPEITGVTAPVAGETPVSTVSGDGYTGTVTWTGNPSTFQPASNYSAIITLTPVPDYYFTGVSANFFTVNGESVTNSANSAVITATFQETGGYGAITCGSGGTATLSNYIVTGNTNCQGSLILPELTTSIGYEAFRGATRLASVYIPINFETIGYGAFEGAAALTSVTFQPGSRLRNISSRAFFGTALETIHIPRTVSAISSHVFENATALRSVTFAPDINLQFLEFDVFRGAISLETIAIPDSVQSIFNGAFRGARALTSVNFGPASRLRTIQREAFYGATSLRSLHLPGRLEFLGDRAFKNATSLTSVTFADESRRITMGDEVFLGASSLVDVELPNIDVESGSYKFLSTAPSLFSRSYVNWKSALPANSNGPTAGEKVFASAFEKPLSVTGLGYGLEEYVYRVTRLENVATSSVDRQNYGGYESLDKDEQDLWYRDMGFIPGTNPYLFSWRAFVCVADAGNTISLSSPPNLSLSYASRDFVPAGTSAKNHLYAFRGASEALERNLSPSTRTVVGRVYDATFTSPPGGADLWMGVASPYSLGISEVHSSCGSGKTLEALEIVHPAGTDPITSKEFEITADFKLKRGTQFFTVSSTGLTIGVTGVLGFSGSFNAALWGLATIASTSPVSVGGGSSGGNAAPVVSPNAPSAKPVAKTRSTIIAGFAGDSSRAPASMRQRISRMSSAFKRVTIVECTGYTSGRTPSRWDTLLANRRAAVACEFVKQRHPSAKVKVIEQPAVGVGSKFRSVRIKIVGF